MMIVKKLPIMGPLISVAMKVKEGMSFITGPDGIIAKIRASFHDFKETFGKVSLRVKYPLSFSGGFGASSSRRSPQLMKNINGNNKK